jgi:PhnB protein
MDDEDSDIEIRPFYEIDDFAVADPDGKVREQEVTLRNTLAMRKAKVNNYLFFSGRCEEALNFYQKHLGAQINFMMRFNESPDTVPADMLQEGFENKVMHADFTLGDSSIYASDGCNDATRFSGFRLSLTLQTAAEAHRVFDALATGGTVDMPLTKTFWSPLYGQVTDQFGIGWMVMLPGDEAPQ